jgi:hypothetical protein
MDKDNIVHFKKVVILKSEVRRMSPIQKKRYIMLTNILRDLVLLQRVLLFVNNYRETDESQDEPVCVDATAVTILFFLETLISKNYEIKKFIYENKIAEEKSKFPPAVKAAFKEMEDFYSDDKVRVLFEFIRHKFGFHYEYQNDIDIVLDQIMDGSRDLVLWFSDTDYGNEVFASSNEVTLAAIFQKMRELGYATEANKDQQEFFMDELLKLALSSSKLSREFCMHYLVEVVLHNVNITQEASVQVCAPLLSEIHLPSIVKFDKLRPSDPASTSQA